MKKHHNYWNTTQKHNFKYKKNYRSNKKFYYSSTNTCTIFFKAFFILLEIVILPFYLLILGISKFIKFIINLIKKEKQKENIIIETPIENSINSKNDNTLPNTTTYEKKSLLTETEKHFETAILKFIPNNFTLQPQVCLASIINKTSDEKYANELYRIIDFGIFDQSRNIVCLIEINDNTHKKPERIERDKKVRKLCEIANIPLITFWTEYNIDENYIEKRITPYINKHL